MSHRYGKQLSLLPTVIDDAWAALARLERAGHCVDVGAAADYLGDLADHGITPRHGRALRHWIARIDELLELEHVITGDPDPKEKP